MQPQITTNVSTELMQIQQSIGNKINDNAPKPLPDFVTKVIEFDETMLPTAIRDYVVDIAERQQCPIDFVAVTAFCAMASVVGRKAAICPKQKDDWTIIPNLWGAIIGRPSAMKTPAMKAALEPLKDIESEATEKFKLAEADYQVDKELAEIKKHSAKKRAGKSITDSNEAEARKILAEAHFSDTQPTRNRLIVNDATVEKLGELQNENPNGLLLVRDEMSGWLSRLAKEEFQADRAYYLECYDGNGSFVYDRIGRGTIDIKSTTLSVIGGIQPSKIIPLVRSAIKGTIDDGLIQRLQLGVWPDDNKSWKWIDRAPNIEAQKKYNAVFKNLHNLQLNNSSDEPYKFRFCNESQALYIQWMEKIQKIARSNELHSALESYLLKLPKTIASIALLIHITDNLEQKSFGTEVSEMAMIQALFWADYLKSHAERLYSLANQDLVAAHLILERLDKLDDEFSARAINRKNWSGLTEPTIVQGGLEYLVDYNHLIAIEIPSTIFGGRPTTLYRKNKTNTIQEKH